MCQWMLTQKGSSFFRKCQSKLVAMTQRCIIHDWACNYNICRTSPGSLVLVRSTEIRSFIGGTLTAFPFVRKATCRVCPRSKIVFYSIVGYGSCFGHVCIVPWALRATFDIGKGTAIFKVFLGPLFPPIVKVKQKEKSRTGREKRKRKKNNKKTNRETQEYR